MSTWPNRGASGGPCGGLDRRREEQSRQSDRANLTQANRPPRNPVRFKSKIRSRVEHVFAVVKRLWGFDKVRYRGLAKNATRAFVTLALANIYLARRPLLEQVRP